MSAVRLFEKAASRIRDPFHICRAQTLGLSSDLKPNSLAFRQRLQSISLDFRMVHKDIIAVVLLDESIASCIAEPFHTTCWDLSGSSCSSRASDVFCIGHQLLYSAPSAQPGESPFFDLTDAFFGESEDVANASQGHGWKIFQSVV